MTRCTRKEYKPTQSASAEAAQTAPSGRSTSNQGSLSGTLEIITAKMLLNSVLPVVLTFFASGTLAGCLPRGPTSSSQCFTRVATTPGPKNVPTSYSTHTSSCVSTQTVKKTITVTKPVVTSTVTKTTTKTTTEKTSKLTSTVTKTSTVSVTTTSTETDTATATSTINVLGATTVAAAAAFTPVQSSLPGAEYGGSGGTDPVEKRDDITPRKNHPFGFGSGSSYPQSCKCNVWVPGKCTTKTVTSTVTTTAKPSTKVTTVTYTVTSTVVPSATKTITITSTSTDSFTATATQTITNTETDTVTTSTTTLYAACATANLADSVNGATIVGLNGNIPYVDQADADTAYDCCVAAITDPNAAGSAIWAWELPGGTGSCQIGYTATCPNPASNAVQAVTGSAEGYVVGNGYCGAWTSSE
ncbi:hypothetical protein BX600DRAFT_428494 [Xylariales sp. PMI_506]|nr:hypothetical protein BX600DRAFT_428494 [Xylariales sp. PMI_506]